MPRAITRLLRTPLGFLVGGAVLCAPVAAADPAPTGGVTYGDGATPVVSADGSSLVGPAGGLLGTTLTFSGQLTGTQPGQSVVIQRLDPRVGWTPVAVAAVAAGGSFTAHWKADWVGSATVRALPTDAVSAAVAATVPPARTLAIFRPSMATWYGPGFYGRRTACGQRMSRTLIGVAHRKLPCGTRVTLFADGRTITASVVDRGPFRHGARWDLTVAAARLLGITTTTRIGVLRAETPAPVAAAPVAAATPAVGSATPGGGGILYSAR